MSTPRVVFPRRVLVHTTAVLLGCSFLLTSALLPVRAEPGAWMAPLDPPLTVVRAFDPPAARWLAGHRGVDLAAADHVSIRATGAGVVTFAGLVAGRGVVVVGHVGVAGRLRSTYEPVAPTVAVGQAVEAGESIGVLTAAGGHCRPAVCLHWGVLRGGSYVDPLALLDPAPVRLLPLGQALFASDDRRLTGSGPWMSLLVGPAQSFDRHVRVDLRGGQ